MLRRTMQEDIGDALECDIDITFHYDEQNELPVAPITGHFVRLESLIEVEDIEFSEYEESPDTLDRAPMLGFMPFQVTSSALRSNCRITNQP